MTNFAQSFAHFPDGPNQAIHSGELRPVFDDLPADVQAWAKQTVNRFDRSDCAQVAVALGVQESVASGLIVLLHDNA